MEKGKRGIDSDFVLSWMLRRVKKICSKKKSEESAEIYCAHDELVETNGNSGRG